MTDITIVDKNNETKMAEGLLYFNVLDINKKYLIYTLNEPINDKIIIYAINVVEPGQEVSQIDEETSKIIKDVISKVSNNLELSNIEFLNMTNVNFSVGNQDVKKFGINPEKKQSFIERQLTSVANKPKNDNTPIVGESSFFNAEVATPNNPEPTQQNEQVNIFDNPMQPDFKEENNTNVQQVNENIFEEQKAVVQSTEKTEETSENISTPLLEETPVEEKNPVTTEIPVSNSTEVVNSLTEKTIVITQEQLDIITDAMNSINSVINNIKVVEKQEVNQDLPSLPQEVIEETQSEIPTGNVLTEESVLSPVSETTTDYQQEQTPIVENTPQIIPTPEIDQLKPVGQDSVIGGGFTDSEQNTVKETTIVNPNTPSMEAMAVAPSLENVHINDSVVDNAPQIITTPETVQLKPVEEAPILGSEITAPIQEPSVGANVQENNIINELPAIEVVSNSEVLPVTQEESVAPTTNATPVVETQSQVNNNGVDLEVYLPDMPALNELEKSPILAQTGQPENEANQAVQIGARPIEEQSVSEEIPTTSSVAPISASETGEKAIETALNQMDNSNGNNYVATAGNSVTVQNPTAVVQGEIPVVMPTGTSAPVQTASTEQVYGPGSLTPEVPVVIESARPIEGMNASQEQPKTLGLTA